MKNIIIILTLVFSAIGTAQSVDSLFVKGNDLYKQEKYHKAIESYKEIENSGVASDELYYNLGNSYYKLNEVAPSIYYYEKALKLNPRNNDVKNNLGFARRMTLDAIEVLPKTIFQKFSDAVIYKLTHNSWAWIAVILSFIAAILFFLYYFSYTPSKKLLFFNTSIISAVLLIFSVVFAFQAYQQKRNTKSAIIFKQTTEIKNAPKLNSDTVFELHEGTKVVVLDAIDDWKKIKLSDGKTGWIIADDMKELQ
jgi:tetratricopeptide (TPR) repeat protein